MRPSEYLASLDPCRSVIFDLDNTIYDEHAFLFDGYRRVVRYVALLAGLDSQEGYEFLRRTYLTEGRVGLFDKFILQFGLKYPVTRDRMLDQLRELSGVRLSCFSYCQEFFPRVSKVFVITNGNLSQQKAKCQSLGLLSLNKDLVIVYAAEHKPKPDDAAYNWLSNHYKLVDPIYIGDDDSDAEFASRCGMAFGKVSFNRDADGMAIEATLCID